MNGYSRCLDTQNGFTFVYPASWLADQTLYRRYAERVERQAALDPPSLSRARARRGGGAPEPSAAYGPPGSSGEENIRSGRRRGWVVSWGLGGWWACSGVELGGSGSPPCSRGCMACAH